MAFQFRKASCVAVGTFNIYIIQPEWLAAVGILPPNSDFSLEANLNQPGFRMASAALKSVWYVTPGRLAIETDSPDGDCGALMAGVLERLASTPIQALGNNISYNRKKDEGDTFPALEACAHGIVVPDDFTERRRQVGITLRRDDREFSITAAVGDGIELNGNANLSLERPDHVAGTKRVVECAKSFAKDKLLLSNLLADVFGVRLNSDVASNV